MLVIPTANLCLKFWRSLEFQKDQASGYVQGSIGWMSSSGISTPGEEVGSCGIATRKVVR
jgi:hypothetical protein